MSDFDYVAEMAKVQRERATEDMLRKMDAADLVEFIHAQEDRESELEAQLEALKKAVGVAVMFRRTLNHSGGRIQGLNQPRLLTYIDALAALLGDKG